MTDPREDHHTNSVEGAEAFERQRSMDAGEHLRDDGPDESDFEQEEIEEECNCSDPCCPCGGYKIGTP